MATHMVARVMIPKAGPLFALATILVAGISAGGVAKRLGVPRVTGQILVGILLGPSVLSVFPQAPLHLLEPITAFALALMTMAVGSHLHLSRVRAAGRRLSILFLTEAFVTPSLIFVGLTQVLGTPWALALLLSVLSVSTAPATIVALVKETRSRGVFVNTLLAAVALNNIACIVLYEMAHAHTRRSLTGAPAASLAQVAARGLGELLCCVLLGVLAAAILLRSTKGALREDKKTTASLVVLLATAGTASLLGFSSLLACLFLGVGLSNLAPNHEGIGDRVFANFEEAILCVFFTMAGMHLNFDYLDKAGALAVAVVSLRILSKQVAAWSAMRIAAAPDDLRRYLGMALVPQAGVAIGLLLLTTNDPDMASVADLLLATGVTVVALNEIVGPILTRQALRWSGNAGKDRARLIDFLGEEHIVTGLEGLSKDEAIETLTQHLFRSQSLSDRPEDFLASVKAREAESSTCLGEGLAVPHGALKAGERMVGVLGLSWNGLDWDTPDGEPVHAIVLLGTPETERERHLQVLGALARIVKHPEARESLFHALSPAHAYVTLHAEEFEEFNTFLEEMDHF